jgi:hypothetical protein
VLTRKAFFFFFCVPYILNTLSATFSPPHFPMNMSAKPPPDIGYSPDFVTPLRTKEDGNAPVCRTIFLIQLRYKAASAAEGFPFRIIYETTQRSDGDGIAQNVVPAL